MPAKTAFKAGTVLRSGSGGRSAQPVDVSLPSDAVMWFDFSDPSTMTLNGTEITAITSKVAGCSDASAVATGPTLSSESLPEESNRLGRNGKFYADFTGGRRMTGTWDAMIWTASTPITAFIVASDVNPNQTVFETSDSLSANNRGVMLLRQNDEMKWRTASSASLQDAGIEDPHTEMRIYRGISDLDNTGQIYTDGVSGNDIAIGPSYNGGAFENFVIGSLLSSGFLFTGNLGEIIIFNRVLNDVEVQEVETYLAKKWRQAYVDGYWPDTDVDAVASYSAANPLNESTTNGTILTVIQDEIGSNDLAFVTGGVANNSFQWLDGKLTVTVPDGERLRSSISAIGSGLAPFCVSIALNPVSLDDNLLWSFADGTSNTTYIDLRIVDNEYTVERRGSAATAEIFNTGVLSNGIPAVITVGYDGVDCFVLVNQGVEVSEAMSRSLPTAPDRFSIGCVDRLSQTAQGTMHFREAVVLNVCPDASGRQAIHDEMIRKNPIEDVWTAEDWSAFGSAVGGWSAQNPDNVSSNEIVTQLVDYVGSTDGYAITGSLFGYDATWTGNRAIVTDGAGSDAWRMENEYIGTGADAFLLSLAFRPTRNADQWVWSIARSADFVNYIAFSIGSGEVQILRRGSSGSSTDTFNTGLFIDDSTNNILTVAWDGTDTHVILNKGGELSATQTIDATLTPDRLCFGALDRATPVISGSCDFREAVIFDECPAASVRRQIHERMIERNILPY